MPIKSDFVPSLSFKKFLKERDVADYTYQKWLYSLDINSNDMGVLNMIIGRLTIDLLIIIFGVDHFFGFFFYFINH
jgi:hypothetical protein